MGLENVEQKPYNGFNVGGKTRSRTKSVGRSTSQGTNQQLNIHKGSTWFTNLPQRSFILPSC